MVSIFPAMPERATYLDHAATTPMRPEVLEAMLPFLGATFGNPSSSHAAGRAARAGLEGARREVAEALGVEPREVVFTSGGTEADNLAILGRALAVRAAGRTPVVAVAATEHKAILAAAHSVGSLGGEERLLPVDRAGRLDLAALGETLSREPAIVSVMWVNNETGVVQPLPRIAAMCEAAGVPLHSDLVQAFGKLAIDLGTLPLPLATISGHKIGAPKGIGALIVRRGIELAPLVTGGGQQGGLRPGTENVAGAVALGRAALLAAREVGAESQRLGALRTALLEGLRQAVPDLHLTADGGETAPHVLSLLFPGADSGILLIHLDQAGIAASGGSACTTGATEPPHVLTAMGVPRELARGVLRLSLGHETTAADIAHAVEVIPVAVRRARALAEGMSHA